MIDGIADVIVVGTGPSGAQAAAACAERGKTVLILDVGYDDPVTRASIPDGDFETLRRSDPHQSRYFVGSALDDGDLTGVRVGAQLTPPRQFIVRGVDALLPLESQTFFPMQSAALGGLGAGWGAGSYSFNDAELEEIGLPAAAMRQWYDEAAADVGINGATGDDTADELLRFRPVLPPLDLDPNCAALFRTYARRRERVRAHGLAVGRAPGAILSEPQTAPGEPRAANPYHDMDFYSDASRSVYRPRYTLERLCRMPNVTYRSGALVQRFRHDEGGVAVSFRDVNDRSEHTVRARRAIVAAGAIGTSRIVLQSLGIVGRDVPILSNPYAYLPCVNLAMLGRPARGRRHSLAQLSGVLTPARRSGDRVLLSIFSYRSLLLFKLVKEMPLPPSLGLLTARLLLSALTIVGVHQPDRRSPKKVMRLAAFGGGFRIEVDYEQSVEEQREIIGNLQQTKAALRAMNCLALGTILPGNGSSIHYAGALTITADRGDALGTDADGRMHAAPSVYIADSANWRFLPAKGLTMTLMANARRVAAAACAGL